MTREEMVKKIGELSPEQKDFLKKEVKKHSAESKENSSSGEQKTKENSKK